MRTFARSCRSMRRTTDMPQKPFKKNDRETHYNKPERGPRKEGSARPERSNTSREDKPYGKRAESDKKQFRPRTDGDRPFTKKTGEDRPFRKSSGPDKDGFGKREEGSGDRTSRPRREDGAKPYGKRTEGSDRPFQKREEGDRPFRPRKMEEGGQERRSFGTRSEGGSGEGSKRPYQKRTDNKDGGSSGAARPSFRKNDTDKPARRPRREDGPVKGSFHSESPTGRKRVFKNDETGGKPPQRASQAYKKITKFDREDIWNDDEREEGGKWDEAAKAGPMTLNKYLAHSGVSSRRDAAAMVKDGRVTVNGEVLKEPGYRVKEGDVILLDGKIMTQQRNFVYILLNKPKDFITTTEDEKGRRTVMDLVAAAEVDKLYPVGRLDRNTTGVLLMTNDGDLAQRLSHPSYETKKIYQVTLSKNVTKADFDKILEGLELEDGKVKVDRLAYLEKKNELGLEIHSGRNRIVRRIFEHLGYEVDKLDRVMYAGLTKKNVSRGKWRFLNEKEITFLKHFKNS